MLFSDSQEVLNSLKSVSKQGSFLTDNAVLIDFYGGRSPNGVGLLFVSDRNARLISLYRSAIRPSRLPIRHRSCGLGLDGRYSDLCPVVNRALWSV